MTLVLTHPPRRGAAARAVYQPPPRTFGPFELGRRLGKGGMAEVHLARRTGAHRASVPEIGALKRLRSDVAIPAVGERFEHECLLSCRIAHPNLVRGYETGKVGSDAFLFAELVLGENLATVADRALAREVRVGTRLAIHVLLGILSGLECLHSLRTKSGRALRVIHRDITPTNVLVAYDGRVRLADLGIAKSALNENQRLTLDGQILGTPHYLPPELVRGEPPAPASDLYGAAAVIYRFLAGVAPYQGTTREVLFQLLSDQRPASLVTLRPDLPVWLSSLIDRMLDRDVSRRPQEAGPLKKQITERASLRGLMIDRSSVSRWVTLLFDEEKRAADDEVEKLLRATALARTTRDRQSTEAAERPAWAWARRTRGADDADATLDEDAERSSGRLPGFVS